MLTELKDFIARGNVVDLAVAVVIGTAFVAVVNALVEGMITPLVGMIFSRDFGDMVFALNDSVFRYGIVVNAALQFLTVAAVVFFLVVKPLNAMAARRGGDRTDEDEPSEEARLLAEIRDLLRSRA